MDIRSCATGLMNHFPNQVMDQGTGINLPMPCLPTLDRPYMEDKPQDLGKYYSPSPIYLDSTLNYFHLKEQSQSLNRCNPQTFKHHNDITSFSSYPSLVQRIPESNTEGVIRLPAPSDDSNINCLPNLMPPFPCSVLYPNDGFGIQKSNLPDKSTTQTENNKIGLNNSTETPIKDYLQLPTVPQITTEKINSEINSKIKSADVEVPHQSKNKTEGDTENSSNQNFVLKTNRVVFCTVCRKGYGSAESLSNHMLTHGPHKCQACGKSFSRQCNLKIHMAVHADRTFLCQECGKSFKSVNSLQTHKNTVHANAENGNIVCDTCGIILKNRKSLVQHEQMHTLGKRFACDLCDERFHRKDALNRHVVRIHVEEKFFTCQVCNIHFNTNEGLQDHLWVHESERPHQCKCCKRRFPQRSGLDRHLKTHLDHRPFTCGVCGLSFTRSYRLKTHMQRHNSATSNQDQK